MEYLAYPKYQETGIDWLGEIPEHWSFRKLRYYSKQVSTGTTPSGDSYFEDATEDWFTPSDFDDRRLELVNSNRKINISALEQGAVKVFPADSVLVIGIGATLGKIGLSKAPFSCNQQINVIIPDDILDSQFLAYSLQVKIEVMKIISNATTIGIMNQNKTKLIDICAPAIDEQKVITAFLNYKTQQIDQLIEKKKALIERLEEQRIAVITKAVTKGLDENVKLIPSGVDWLGDVPEHWEIKRLKFVGSAIMGLIYDPKDIVNKGEGHLVLRASNIQEGKMVNKDNVYVDMPVPDKLVTRRDDILICSRNGSRALIGKNALIEEEFKGSSFGAFTTVFRSDINDFLYFVFNSSLFSYQAGKYLTSTINQLTIDVINSFEVPIPDKAERKEIVIYLKEKLKKLDRSKQSTLNLIHKLKEYRSAIITSAVTGKIDVRDIDIPEDVA
ncbi:restriction endonuclease subunit S [Paraphotobacterium marinum]|uniref:Restriction endonuclease subunit S n=1 Tax=Paraphotobacterium marinum TaxID=1755811 RepID=A0A220VG23_9GAMM|nr:restriction endonuclease subunit S [Paraphotobacterium marinum]ASK79132.1 restriction endonuclease subunit S [Paraphotobacterium marinum]